ncbi:hypothetical protein AbraIFM66950_003554 [Aspergillus brasiliensis]|nr:hypothetical protein AbraIFM66950_003554 [Aspergillus brasiliensis]
MAIANEKARSKARGLYSTVLELDDDRRWTPHVTSSQAEFNVERNSAAYMIFTSGSTGTLEGAVIEHASLAIAWKTLRLQLNRGPTSRVLQLVSHSWGAPMIGVMAALMSGGCLCIASEHEQMGNLASAANRMLTQTVARSELAYLESLILGGEPVTRSNIEVWHDKVCLLSAYGPAERTQPASVTKPLDLNCNARKTGVPNASVGWAVRQDDPQQLVPDGAVGAWGS